MLQRAKPQMNLQEAAVLSYLIGLQPIGEEVFVKLEWISKDLSFCGLRRSNTIQHIINQLIAAKAISRVQRSHYIVHKRPEDYNVEAGWSTGERFNTSEWRLYGLSYNQTSRPADVCDGADQVSVGDHCLQPINQ